MQVEALGRTIKETDHAQYGANEIVTYTVYIDNTADLGASIADSSEAIKEARTYAGWNNTLHAPTGPTQVTTC